VGDEMEVNIDRSRKYEEVQKVGITE